MDIRFLGHSAFALSHEGTTVLVDPFLTGNPKAAAQASEVEADAILLTHGHVDHLGDTVDIARRTGAPVVAIVELAGEIADDLGPDHLVLDPNLGGHGRARVGVGAPDTGVAHVHDPQGHDQHAGGPGDRARRQADLPPGRHRAVLRPRAAAPARAHRRRADVHRRPLHDGPLRRGRRRRARGGRPGHPLPLRHVPADRDRRRRPSSRTCSRPATPRSWSSSPGETHAA